MPKTKNDGDLIVLTEEVGTNQEASTLDPTAGMGPEDAERHRNSLASVQEFLSSKDRPSGGDDGDESVDDFMDADEEGGAAPPWSIYKDGTKENDRPQKGDDGRTAGKRGLREQVPGQGTGQASDQLDDFKELEIGLGKARAKMGDRVEDENWEVNLLKSELVRARRKLREAAAAQEAFAASLAGGNGHISTKEDSRKDVMPRRMTSTPHPAGGKGVRFQTPLPGSEVRGQGTLEGNPGEPQALHWGLEYYLPGEPTPRSMMDQRERQPNGVLVRAVPLDMSTVPVTNIFKATENRYVVLNKSVENCTALVYYKSDGRGKWTPEDPSITTDEELEEIELMLAYGALGMAGLRSVIPRKQRLLKVQMALLYASSRGRGATSQPIGPPPIQRLADTEVPRHRGTMGQNQDMGYLLNRIQELEAEARAKESRTRPEAIASAKERSSLGSGSLTSVKGREDIWGTRAAIIDTPKDGERDSATHSELKTLRERLGPIKSLSNWEVNRIKSFPRLYRQIKTYFESRQWSHRVQLEALSYICELKEGYQPAEMAEAGVPYDAIWRRMQASNSQREGAIEARKKLDKLYNTRPEDEAAALLIPTAMDHLSCIIHKGDASQQQRLLEEYLINYVRRYFPGAKALFLMKLEEYKMKEARRQEEGLTGPPEGELDYSTYLVQEARAVLDGLSPASESQVSKAEATSEASSASSKSKGIAKFFRPKANIHAIDTITEGDMDEDQETQGKPQGSAWVATLETSADRPQCKKCTAGGHDHGRCFRYPGKADNGQFVPTEPSSNPCDKCQGFHLNDVEGFCLAGLSAKNYGIYHKGLLATSLSGSNMRSRPLHNNNMQGGQQTGNYQGYNASGAQAPRFPSIPFQGQGSHQFGQLRPQQFSGYQPPLPMHQRAPFTGRHEPGRQQETSRSVMAIEAPGPRTQADDEDSHQIDPDHFAVGKLPNGEEVAYIRRDQIPDDLLPDGQRTTQGHQVNALTVVPSDVDPAASASEGL